MFLKLSAQMSFKYVNVLGAIAETALCRMPYNKRTRKDQRLSDYYYVLCKD